jgi:hypothetical protein
VNPCAADGWDYNSCGLAGWVTRKKFGGPYQLAPIMSDRFQAVGTWSTTANSGVLIWTDTDGKTTVPTGNHLDIGTGLVPTGGNFLFEDGHAKWLRFDAKNPRATVDAGSIYNGWVTFYKVPNIVTN